MDPGLILLATWLLSVTVFEAAKASADDQNGQPGSVSTSSDMLPEAEPPPLPPRIAGDWPKKLPKVTIDISNGTVADALSSLAKQTSMGLVIGSEAGALPRNPITVKLTRYSAKDALEIILKNGKLKADVENEILFIGPYGETEEGSLDGNQIDTDGKPFPMISVVPGAGSQSHAQHPHKTGVKDRVQVGKSLRIEAGEEVKDAVAVGGSLTVFGRVLGDAVAIGGPVTIEPGAYVRGEATAVGGSVNVKSGATVEGEQVGIGIPIAGFFDILKDRGGPWKNDWKAPGFTDTFTAFSILGFLLRSVLLFVFCLIVIAIMPNRVAGVRIYLSQKPGQSILAGIGLLLALIPVIILLAITIIGIPLIPVVLVGLPLLMVFGLTALFSLLGYQLPLFESKKGQIGATAIGVAFFMLVGLVPFAGPVILTLAAFASVGAVLLSRFGLDSTKKLPAKV